VAKENKIIHKRIEQLEVEKKTPKVKKSDPASLSKDIEGGR